MNAPHTFSLRASLVAIFSCTLLLTITASVQADQFTFNINADGMQEVDGAGTPNQGDLDGSAIGTITLNDGNGTGMDLTGSATFSLTLSNIDLSNLTGHHFHMAPFGMNGAIRLDFGDPDTVLSGNMLTGTIMNLRADRIQEVFAGPTGFYYNLHNGSFPAGAVRDQLVPEPGVGALLLLGAAGAYFVRRRRN